MKKNQNALIRYAALVLTAILVTSLSYIVFYFKERNDAKVIKPIVTENAIIRETDIGAVLELPKFDRPEKVEESKEPIEDEEIIQMIPGYDELLSINPDFIGWIEINDTQVNNPIVYPSQGNDYYLKHSFYNDYNSRGTLFIQENTSFDDHATIIYGHYMKDGTMFGELKKFTDEDFFNNHQYITITDLYEEKTYEVISVFKDYVHTTDDTSFKFYKYYGNPDEEEFNRMINFITNNSIHSRHIDKLTIDDHIIQLVTCSYHVTNGRLSVVIKEVK